MVSDEVSVEPAFLPLSCACPFAAGRDVLEPQGPQNLRNGADATVLFWTFLDLLDLNLISSSRALIPGQAWLKPVLLDQCMGSPWGACDHSTCSQCSARDPLTSLGTGFFLLSLPAPLLHSDGNC